MRTHVIAPDRGGELRALRSSLLRIRGNLELPPEASIIIPVNASADLDTVLQLLRDIASYRGRHRIEVVLVINNYPAEHVPLAVEEFRHAGLVVVATPSARRPGEVVIISARALGVGAAHANVTIHFDADCRIRSIDDLIDWYIATLGAGAGLAYSHVGFYALRNRRSIQVKIAIHHLARWVKREILRIPTTRGSNYAITRCLFMDMYAAGRMSVDLQVGPAAKLLGAWVMYSGRPELTVVTSGRRFHGGWLKLVRYMVRRLRYNLHAIPTRYGDVTRVSWHGFDEETEKRTLEDLAAELSPREAVR